MGAFDDLIPSGSGTSGGVPDEYLATLAKVESNDNPNAKNPNSSASGRYQMTDATRGQYGDDINALTKDNKAALTKTFGRDPSPEELYLAHQQGATGAKRLLDNPNMSAVSLVGKKAVIDNGGTPDMTGHQFAQHVMNTFTSKSSPDTSITTSSQSISDKPLISAAMVTPSNSESAEAPYSAAADPRFAGMAHVTVHPEDSVKTSPDGGSANAGSSSAGAFDDLIPEASPPNSVGRTLGRAARSLAVGAATGGDLAALPFNAGYSAVKGMMGEPVDQSQLLSPARTTKDLIDKATGGNLKPSGGLEQGVDDASEFLASLVTGSAEARIAATGADAMAKIAPKAIKGVAEGSAKVLSQLGEVPSTGTAVGGAVGYGAGNQADDSGAGGISLSILGSIVGHDPQAALNALVKSGKMPAQVASNVMDAIKQKGLIPAIQDSLAATGKSMSGALDKSPYQALPDDEKALADTIQNEGINPGKSAAEMQKARQAGYTLPMAEAAQSPALRGLGQDVAKTTVGSQAAQAAYNNASGKETSDILQKITEKTAGRPGTVDDFSKAFQEGAQGIIGNAVKTRSDNAKKVFNSIVKKGTNVNINGIMKDPDVAQQIVASIARVKSEYPSLAKAGYNDIRILHLVQQDLNSFYKEGSQIGKGARNKAYNALIGQMESQIPDYKVGRNAYKTDSQHLEDLKDGPIGLIADLGAQNFDDAGKKILGMPPSTVSQLRKQFMTLKRGKNGLTGANVFDGMMASAVGKMVGSKTAGRAGSIAAKLLTPENQAVINAGLNPTKAKQLSGFLQTLDDSFGAQKALASYTGKTAQPMPQKNALASAVDLATAVVRPGGLKSYFTNAAKENLMGNQAAVDNLGKYLFTQEGEQFLRKMASLQNAQQKQAAAAALTYKVAKKRIPMPLVQVIRNTTMGSLLLNNKNYEGENNAQ